MSFQAFIEIVTLEDFTYKVASLKSPNHSIINVSLKLTGLDVLKNELNSRRDVCANINAYLYI